ncbi:MAG: hypothetical protein JSW56_08000 [Deltaproteobacteria bacterium]|nr:MAG: hypothetical protein JSW56_08000 [Deltaproteobacteria bacterium]
MKDPKQTKSAKPERPEGSHSKFSCCNFENMAQMMRKFCGVEDGSFDCCAMMEKMCGADRKKSDQK